MSKIAITNGLLINPAQTAPHLSNLYIADGKIVAHGQAPHGFHAEITLDAQQQWVCPGLVDLSAHLGEPGLVNKNTIARESNAAIKRGITTVCCPPDFSPIIDAGEIAIAIQQLTQQIQQAHVVTLGALTMAFAGTHLSPMAALKQAGCVGVSNAKQPIADTRVLYNALAYAATYDLTVFLFANDPWLMQEGCVHDGSISTRLGLPGIPSCAETIGVSRALALQQATGARLHLCRLSCAESVKLINAAIEQGQAVTADVAIHQLFLTEMDVNDFNNFCHTQPPIRSLTDQQALLNGIQNGIITAICSDHEPRESAAKLQPFPNSAPGISGIDTFLALTINLQEKLKLTLNQLISLISANPAKILGLPKGTLNVNSPADVCIINPGYQWTLTSESMLSLGKNSPFLGWPLRGNVQTTIVDGEIRYQS